MEGGSGLVSDLVLGGGFQDLDRVCEWTDGYSGADLKALCTEAAVRTPSDVSVCCVCVDLRCSRCLPTCGVCVWVAAVRW